MEESLSAQLLRAAMAGDISAVLALEDKGLNLGTKNQVALRMAAQHGHLELVRIFVEEKGFDVHLQEEGALRNAVEYGHFDIVQYLTQKGANIRVLSDDPLRSAMDHGYLEMADFLINRGADPHVIDDLMFRFAATCGNTRTINFLFNRDKAYYVELIKGDEELSSNPNLAGLINYHHLADSINTIPSVRRKIAL